MPPTVAVTSTVAVISPVSSFRFSVDSRPTLTVTLFATALLKPVCSTRTVYVPGSRLSTLKMPLSFVVALRSTCGPVTVILAPGIAAPAGSVIKPPIVPLVCTSCPNALAAARHRQNAIDKDQSFLIADFSLSKNQYLSLALAHIAEHSRERHLF